MGGSYSTLSGTDPTANQFFGPNAENFVIGTGGYANADGGGEAAGAFNDFSLNTGEDSADTGVFGTTHVATLNDSNVAGIGETRTARTLTGFAAGAVDVALYCDGLCESGTVLATGGPESGDGITLSFDPQHDTLSGQLNIHSNDPEILGNLNLGIGSQPGGDGKSAFIDDNVYAAREANDPSSTTASYDAGEGGTVQLSQTADQNANTYLVSSGTVPLDHPAFMNGASCTSCSFMQWGWWGTQVQFDELGKLGRHD